MQHLRQGTIHAWLDGALPAEEAARVERHAAECAECALLVAEARGLVAGASRIMSALDDVPAVRPRDVASGKWDAVAARASRAGQGAPAHLASRRQFWFRPAALAAAASVVLMVGTAVVVTKSGGPSPRAVADATSMASTGESNVDTTTPSAGTTGPPSPAVGGADAAGGTAAASPPGRPMAGRGGASVGLAERRGARAADGAAKRAIAGRGLAAGTLRDSAALPLTSRAVAGNSGLEPSATAQRGVPAVSEKAMPVPAPARPPERVALEAVARADSSSSAVAAARAPTEWAAPNRRAAAARARSERPVPTTAAEVRSDTVTTARVDTLTVEPPESPRYRPEGRAGAAARPFPVTGCYEVLEGGLPRHITLKTNSVWSGVAEHAFVATAEGAIGYWSQPRTGAVYLVIAGAVVTARVDASTGDLRGTAQRGRKTVTFVARRGCK